MTSMSRMSGTGKKSHASSARSGGKVGDADVISGVVASKAIFYKEAAGKTRNPVGKKMFLSMMEDERKQIEAFRSVPEELDIKVRGATSTIRRIRTFVEKNWDALLERIKATTDEVDALRIAMEMEKRSIEFYEKLAGKVKGTKEKALLESLVKEEQQRYEIFLNTYIFLSNSGSWFMWDEHSMMDGGTPWA